MALILEPPSPTTVRNNDLVAKAKAGDAAAFELLYKQHVGRVYAICLRMIANTRRAEELTQDTFVQAWRKLEGFREESAFSSWLYRIAVNVVLVALRTDRRRQARILSTDDLSPFDRSHEDYASGSQMDLEKGIASLPPKARMVLILHEIEGYQHHEIAEMMGTAPGTSKAQLHRARKLLKQRLNR